MFHSHMDPELQKQRLLDEYAFQTPQMLTVDYQVQMANGNHDPQELVFSLGPHYTFRELAAK